MHQMKPNREDHFGKFFMPTEEEKYAMGLKKYPEARRWLRSAGRSITAPGRLSGSRSGWMKGRTKGT